MMSDGNPYNYTRNVGSTVRPTHNNSDDSSDFQISESVRSGIMETSEDTSPTNDETTISTEERTKTEKGGN